jgi:hypothetical protein
MESSLIGSEEKVAAVRPVAPVGRGVTAAVCPWQELRLIVGADKEGDGDYAIESEEQPAPRDAYDPYTERDEVPYKRNYSLCLSVRGSRNSHLDFSGLTQVALVCKPDKNIRPPGITS